LGYGYDVIESSYINIEGVKKLHPILDQEKMIADGLVTSEPIASVQKFEQFVGSNLTKFYEERNERIGLGLNASVPFKAVLFSGEFKSEFGVSIKEDKIDTHTYLRGRSYHYTHHEYISQGRATAERLAKYLSEGFAADMHSRTAAQILDRYGSHVFIQYYKGGAMEYNYAYYGTDLTNSTELSSALSASLSVKAIAGAEVGFSSDLQAKKEIIRNQLENNSTFRSLTYGGRLINISDLNLIESNYTVWLNSISSNPDICGIGKFDESFISVWELAEASGELELADKLKAEFLNRATNQENNLRTKKAIVVPEQFTTIGTNTYIFDKNFPATIEIYALGAGGGGQGGYDAQNMAASHNGTGAGGGGGAATYAKFSVSQPCTFTVTVGKGGDGGVDFFNAWNLLNSKWESGISGANGGNTSVSWDGNIITANGGRGGGMNRSSDVHDFTGGAGGTANTQWPAGILEHLSDIGANGNNGAQDSNREISGGKAGSISIGSLASFGGGSGAIRRTNGTTTEAKSGGGGAGEYKNNGGSRGGDGEVRIIITYFQE
jgi:hypothetical protein